MATNIQIKNVKSKRLSDMKADYLALYLEGYRKEIALQMLGEKYYLEPSSVNAYLQPFAPMHKEGQRLMRIKMKLGRYPSDYHPIEFRHEL